MSIGLLGAFGLILSALLAIFLIEFLALDFALDCL
jgi:hypothetical protein